MNPSCALWSMPWHARLKNLADGLRAEVPDNFVTASKFGRARNAPSADGSWLRRKRSRPAPSSPAGR